jgi:hypothetical protein
MVSNEDVRKVMEGMWAGHGVVSSNFCFVVTTSPLVF